MKSTSVLIVTLMAAFFAKAHDVEVPYRRIVCYRNNIPDNVEHCTHAIPVSMAVNSRTAYIDSDNEPHFRLRHYRYSNSTVLLNLDPVIRWNEPQVITSSIGRTRIVRSAVSYLKNEGYDGLDVVIDKEYMKETILLMRLMREEFDKNGLILTGLTSSCSADDLISEIIGTVDFLSIKCFSVTKDQPFTELLAPLYSNTPWSWSMNSSAQSYISKGVPPKKIVMGIPTFAKTHLLDNPDSDYIGANASHPGYQDSVIRKKGLMALNKITGPPDWRMHRDCVSKAPFASNYILWASYDDDLSVKTKALYIKDNGLGGAMLQPSEAEDGKQALPFSELLHRIFWDE